MKKGFKALLLLLIIVLVIGAIVYFVIKGNEGHTASEEDLEVSNRIAINAISNLTYGYGTQYKGIDLLYEFDKYTYDNLSTSNILTTAIRYIDENEGGTSFSSTAAQEIKDKYQLDYEEYTIYKGEKVRNAIKEIFGVDWQNQGSTYEVNFNYEILYVEEYDYYYFKQTTDFSEISEYFTIVTQVLDTTVKDEKLITEIAVAYVSNASGKYKYATDSSISNVIFESDELKSELEKQDKFDKYLITLKKSGESYVFESITKE